MGGIGNERTGRKKTYKAGNQAGTVQTGGDSATKFEEVFEMNENSRISNSCKVDPWGNRFWCLGQAGRTKDGECMELECTYDDDLNIINYYINRFLVTQDSLITNLADNYDNEHTRQDIKDSLTTEAAHETFLKEHGGEL